METSNGRIGPRWKYSAIVRQEQSATASNFPGKLLYQAMAGLVTSHISPKADIIALIDHPQLGDECGGLRC